MTIQVHNDLRNKLLNLLLRSDQATFANPIVFAAYTGSPPGVSSVASTAIGTVGNALPFLASSGGVRTLNGDFSSNGVGTGTIGFARFYGQAVSSYSSTGLIEGSVGVAGSGADFIFETLSLSSSQWKLKASTAFKIPASNGTVKLSNTIRDALLDNLFLISGYTHLNLGNSGTISIYSGSAPASADDAATGTLLWSISTGTNCWNAASGGSSVLAATLSANGAATGTAGYARITKGAYCLQCSVGTGGADMILSTTSIVSGVSASITDATIVL